MHYSVWDELGDADGLFAAIVAMDGDLASALGENRTELSSQITRVILALEGEHDGPHYFWWVELGNGKFALIDGWCDYTGWDCQSGVDVTEGDTLSECATLANLDTTVRLHLEDMIVKGESRRKNPSSW